MYVVSRDALPISALLELIKKPPTEEIITLRELELLLETTCSPVAYCGYEPSGPVHLGRWISIKKLIDLQEVDFKVKFLLANCHAWLNRKGSLEWIRKVAKYHKHCVVASGGDPEENSKRKFRSYHGLDWLGVVENIETGTFIRLHNRKSDIVSAPLFERKNAPRQWFKFEQPQEPKPEPKSSLWQTIKSL